MKNTIPLFLHEFENEALRLDDADPLKKFREMFSIPKNSLGESKIYLCNNSLGLVPKQTFKLMELQLKQWESFGVDGWFQMTNGWYSCFDQQLRGPLSLLLGAKEEEVVFMNTLTTNLHLLLVSFYRPTPRRSKILIEAPVFPSDLYAIKSHLSYHGYDPDKDLIIVEPCQPHRFLQSEDIERMLNHEGQNIALVFLSGVNFLTGQVLEMLRITQLAHHYGCLVGYDLAHAAGNVVLHLHEWEVDFAVGCSYKYLCSGPGGPGFAFVHAKHHNEELPRFSGWWGNDPSTRFQMQLQSEFIPYGGASSWQLSTPSVFALTPLLASMAIFEEAKIENLRIKSEKQTAYLLKLLETMPTIDFEVFTPQNPMERGSQISLLIKNCAQDYLAHLEKLDIVVDFRPPNIIRVTPSALYNTFYEIFVFACHFACISIKPDLLPKSALRDI